MINNAQELTSRGWVIDDGIQPPGFYYPHAERPHLHLSAAWQTGTMNPPWHLDFLAYTPSEGKQIVIYKRSNPGVDNRTAIDLIPEEAGCREEATWVYDNLK